MQALSVGAGTGGVVGDPAAAGHRLLDARGLRPRRRAPARRRAPEPAQRARAASRWPTCWWRRAILARRATCCCRRSRRFRRRARRSGGSAGSARMAATRLRALQAYEAASRLAPFAGASIVYAAIGRLQHNTLDLDAAARAYERRVALAPLAARRASRSRRACITRRTGSTTRWPSTWRPRCSIPQERARVRRRSARCAPTWATTQGAIAMLQRAVALDAHTAATRATRSAGRCCGWAATDEARQELAAFERMQKRGDGGAAAPVRGERARDRRRRCRK